MNMTITPERVRAAYEQIDLEPICGKYIEFDEKGEQPIGCCPLVAVCVAEHGIDPESIGPYVERVITETLGIDSVYLAKFTSGVDGHIRYGCMDTSAYIDGKRVREQLVEQIYWHRYARQHHNGVVPSEKVRRAILMHRRAHTIG